MSPIHHTTDRLKTMLSSPFWRVLSPGAVCLVYHRVQSDDESPHPISSLAGLSVKRDQFEKQMAFVAKYFNPIPIDTAISLLANRELTSKHIIVTFDDGYRDNLEIALPILEKYQVPATIYLTIGAAERELVAWWYELGDRMIRHGDAGTIVVGGKNLVWKSARERDACYNELNEVLKKSNPKEISRVFDSPEFDRACWARRNYLNWEQVAMLDQHPLITIGCHTMNHDSLTSLTPEELAGDLELSKSRLERELGHPVQHFAYPYGGRSEAGAREFLAARAAGFTTAVTTRYGHWQSAHVDALYSLPRISVPIQDSMTAFRLKLNGLRDWRRNGWHRLVTD